MVKPAILSFVLLVAAAAAQEPELDYAGYIAKPGGPGTMQALDLFPCPDAPDEKCFLYDFSDSVEWQGWGHIPALNTDATFEEKWTEPQLAEKLRLKAEPGWDNKTVQSVLALDWPNVLGICGWDWYSIAANHHASHCWYNVETQEMLGTYTLDASWDFHPVNVAGYLARIPQAWANEHLAAAGERWCLTGNRKNGWPREFNSREVRNLGGPTLIAMRCEPPTVAAPGPIETPVQLLYANTHPNPFGTANAVQYGTMELPPLTNAPSGTVDWRFQSVKTKCSDIAWTGGDWIFAACLHGGPKWAYGLAYSTTGYDPDAPDPALRPEIYRQCPGRSTIGGTDYNCKDFVPPGKWLTPWHNGEENPGFNFLGRPDLSSGESINDPCQPYRGFRARFEDDAPGYSPEIWAWHADDLAAVLSGEKTFYEAHPRFRYSLGRSCDEPEALAFDPDLSRLYVHHGKDRSMGYPRATLKVFDVSFGAPEPCEECACDPSLCDPAPPPPPPPPPPECESSEVELFIDGEPVDVSLVGCQEAP